jgi:hypothetical protein
MTLRAGGCRQNARAARREGQGTQAEEASAGGVISRCETSWIDGYAPNPSSFLCVQGCCTIAQLPPAPSLAGKPSIDKGERPCDILERSAFGRDAE